jgi:hypothetical protein
LEAWTDAILWGVGAIGLAGTAIYFFWTKYRKTGIAKAFANLAGWCLSALSVAMVFGARGHYGEANALEDAHWYACMTFGITFSVGVFYSSVLMVEPKSGS